MNLEFHFDFGSPNAYLSHRLIPLIEQRTGVTFQYVPVLLGGVFKATNNVSPAVSMQGIKNKSEYSAIETDRFLARHDITDYHFNPFFPVNTLHIMRGAVYAHQAGIFPAYVEAVYQHMWNEPKKMDEPDVIHAALLASNLPADDIMQGSQDPQVKKQLIDNTDRSVEMGTFGSPTFYLDGAIYFGKDKLDDLEAAIRAKSGSV